jgi:hypothetical protein
VRHTTLESDDETHTSHTSVFSHSRAPRRIVSFRNGARATRAEAFLSSAMDAKKHVPDFVGLIPRRVGVIRLYEPRLPCLSEAEERAAARALR